MDEHAAVHSLAIDRVTNQIGIIVREVQNLLVIRVNQLDSQCAGILPKAIAVNGQSGRPDKLPLVFMVQPAKAINAINSHLVNHAAGLTLLCADCSAYIRQLASVQHDQALDRVGDCLFMDGNAPHFTGDNIAVVRTSNGVAIFLVGSLHSPD